MAALAKIPPSAVMPAGPAGGPAPAARLLS
jgi:hypothetical protein